MAIYFKGDSLDKTSCLLTKEHVVRSRAHWSIPGGKPSDVVVGRGTARSTIIVECTIGAIGLRCGGVDLGQAVRCRSWHNDEEGVGEINGDGIISVFSTLA